MVFISFHAKEAGVLGASAVWGGIRCFRIFKELHQQNVDPVGKVGVFVTALASLGLSQFKWEHLISLFFLES